MSPTATIRTRTDHPTIIAGALRPDNTAEMTTETTGDIVVTRIERDSTRGLQATVDDYVVNVGVARQLVQLVTESKDTPSSTTQTNQ
ncbi:MAG: KEOPS complex subunit Pcc1 [Natrialbaceae archaeon]|nr:KEOPS complex subunit Pcc1 [Natrialbaceae archaeon]